MWPFKDKPVECEHCGSMFQTLYGCGALCHICGVLKWYKKWPEGYDMQAVPDWSISPEELFRKLKE